ncbi:hypothetical protein [Streptomyces erythrochromogenes]|uniref:hypothetical protein n=1 Tax=Streptomyces erythrochromogenes TaxID=285574 RepID=UPI0038634A61|nr:hypothetical protein OG489_18530 [Streptomyces erythrochromogenes]
MPADKRVTRASFHDLTPLSVPRPMSVLPTRNWTDAQWERIKLGYQSADMDEKWDVFTEDDVVFPERYGGTSGMRAALTLELVLSTIVLGEDAPELRTRLVELATPSSSNDALPGVVLHSILGLRSGT